MSSEPYDGIEGSRGSKIDLAARRRELSLMPSANLGSLWLVASLSEIRDNPTAAVAVRSWLQGILEHRPLRYEPRAVGNFNNLQDAGGSLEPCKERLGNIIGQLMDRRVFEDFTTTAVVF
jgi:hypothetical protein